MGGNSWSGQIGCAEFPIRASWGVVPSDKVMHPAATFDELCRIEIVRDWDTQHPLQVNSEVLLGEDHLAAFLPLLGHVIPSACGISIRPFSNLSGKRALDLPSEGKGKSARSEPSTHCCRRPWPQGLLASGVLALGRLCNLLVFPYLLRCRSIVTRKESLRIWAHPTSPFLLWP